MFRKIIQAILGLVFSISLGLFCIIEIQDNLPSLYSTWIENTPTVNNKTKTIHKKESFTMTPPSQNGTQQLTDMTNAANLGLTYKGRIFSYDNGIDTSLYQDQTSKNGVSDYLLNAGVAGMYKDSSQKFGESNVVAAGHTYIEPNDMNKVFTPLQYKTKKGDKIYVTDGQKVYEYDVFDISIGKVQASDGGYILDKDRWKDTAVNPSKKPMLTLYDCTEPENPSEFIQNPPYRNVVLASLSNVQSVSDFQNEHEQEFKGTPIVKTRTKDGKVELKDTPRTGRTDLQILDFMFKDLKLQDNLGKIDINSLIS